MPPMAEIFTPTPKASSVPLSGRGFKRPDRRVAFRRGSLNVAAIRDDSEALLQAIEERAHWVDSCWVWTGSMTSSGRPYLTVLSRRTNLRRLVLELDGRPCDKDEIAVVTCGTVNCVNPEHLDISRRA